MVMGMCEFVRSKKVMQTEKLAGYYVYSWSEGNNRIRLRKPCQYSKPEITSKYFWQIWFTIVLVLVQGLNQLRLWWTLKANIKKVTLLPQTVVLLKEWQNLWHYFLYSQYHSCTMVEQYITKYKVRMPRKSPKVYYWKFDHYIIH